MNIPLKYAAIGLLFLSASALFGHPPDSLQLGLDSTGTLFSVKVFHPVKNPSHHFIITIDVKVNNALSVEQTFGGQLDQEIQEGIYKLINLKAGDKIEVTAVCSITGNKKAVYSVPQK